MKENFWKNIKIPPVGKMEDRIGWFTFADKMMEENSKIFFNDINWLEEHLESF